MSVNILLNSDNIYHRVALKEDIIVEPKYLNENLNTYIVDYLKNKKEGKCVKEGFIKTNSVRFLERGAGILSGSRFTGDMTFEVKYVAEICNPSIGTVVDCKVRFLNKLGIKGYNGPLTIIVPREFHEDNLEVFDTIKVGDILKVEILYKEFSLKDTEIRISGKIHGLDNKKKKNQKKEIPIEDIKKKNENILEEESEEEVDSMDEENEVDDIELSESEGSEAGSEEDDEEEDDSEDAQSLEESESEDDDQSIQEGGDGENEDGMNNFVSQLKKDGMMDTKEDFGDDFSVGSGDDDYDDSGSDDGYYSS